ncbi:MAG: hypothetical protein ACREYB_05185 [Casimicrobiaceae bacterium]
MSSIGLDPVEAADFEDHVARTPATPNVDPWLTWSTPLSPLAGAAGGIANLAYGGEELATPVLRPIAKAIDDQFGTSSADWLDTQQRLARDAILRTTIGPSTVGRVGEIVGGAFQYGVEALGGAAVGGLPGAAAVTGITEGLVRYRKLIADGTDPATAAQLAGVEGLVAGASATLPLVGKSMGESLLRGALLMPYMNAWQRGVTHQVLDNAGYHDMAQQYRILDGRAILTDALMGGLFGGVGHAFHDAGAPVSPFKSSWQKVLEARTPLERAQDEAMAAGYRTPAAEFYPQETGAALTDATVRHVEAAGPGIPADPYTRNANVAAVEKAIDDMLSGRPVDVSQQIDPERASFVADPHAAAFRDQVTAIAKDTIGELPGDREEEHGPAIQDAQRMQAEAGFGAADENQIAAAVVRFGGKEFDAPTHIAAIKQAMAEGLLQRTATGKITLGENDSINLFRLKDGSLVTRDEAAALTGAKRTEELPTLTGGASLESIRSEIGWAERGGRILRQPMEGEALHELGQTGEVIGRTGWIPRSDFWPARPDKSLSERGAHAALDKVTSGERLTPREQRFVDYSRHTLQERGALEEAMRLESTQERVAIQAESGVTDADLIDSGYLALSPQERIAVEQLAAHTADLEAQRNEIERLNQEHRAALAGGDRAPIAGEPRPGAQNAPQGRGAAQGPGGGQRRAASGEAQAQDAIAPATAAGEQGKQTALERSVQRALLDNPAMLVPTADGSALPLRDAIAAADAEIRDAAKAQDMLDAAIDCAARG